MKFGGIKGSPYFTQVPGMKLCLGRWMPIREKWEKEGGKREENDRQGEISSEKAL